jgi:threonine aldolase
MKSFASDNNSGACPEVMEALAAANRGHAIGYGDDPWTERAASAFRREFGEEAEAFFVLNGTGANVLALSLVAGAGTAVLCSDCAHVAVDETGAPEAAIGCKVLGLESRRGKILPEALSRAVERMDFIHQALPACLSVTQPTELGTLYAPEELAELFGIARSAGLAIHMDGARIANAAAALGLPLREAAAGVDLLSFGGMKNGVAFGEALVVLEPRLAPRVPRMRKARLQLASKMRFISAQYEAYISDGVWERNARAANAAAARLETGARAIAGIEIAYPVQANAVFARMDHRAAEAARARCFFYELEPGLQRWMTSFDTTAEDVDGFLGILREASAP